MNEPASQLSDPQTGLTLTLRGFRRASDDVPGNSASGDNFLSGEKLAAGDGDLDALLRLDEQCFAPAFRFDRETMRRLTHASNSFTCIAEEESLVAGFVIAGRWGSLAYLQTLDVSPAYRRRGVASCLMKQIEDVLRQAGVEILELHVSIANASAIAFYRKWGFHPTGSVRNYYGKLGGDAFTFAKNL